MNELLCCVQLFAEFLHLLVVDETLLVILVELETLSDVTAQRRTDREDERSWGGAKVGTVYFDFKQILSTEVALKTETSCVA